jgi:hypothetical protein
LVLNARAVLLLLLLCFEGKKKQEKTTSFSQKFSFLVEAKKLFRRRTKATAACHSTHLRHPPAPQLAAAFRSFKLQHGKAIQGRPARGPARRG